MKMDNLPEINETWYDPNYVVCMIDITSTLAFKEGLCNDGDEKVLKAILRLFGMDLNRNITETHLDKDASVRSNITGLIQKGGVIFQGYERKDPTWKKQGLKITEQYLYSPCSPLFEFLRTHNEKEK